MKNIIIIMFFSIATIAYSQQNKSIIVGNVSYLSSQNVYVKFTSTDGIKVGDTLFTKNNDELIPVVQVNYISSKSCSGVKLTQSKIEIGMPVLTFVEKQKEKLPAELVILSTQKEIIPEKKSSSKLRKNEGEISGRFSLSSYGNISSINSTDYLRWRYTFSARSQNYQSSKFSFDSYISFNYRSTEWSYIKNNISDALKIYSLSVNYQFNENLNLTFGRKINRSISNIGAVDGFQLEGELNNFNAGLIIGSRPDYQNYTYNFNFFEFGGFVSHSQNYVYGSMQNSLAVFQQTNDFKIDRRFLYFQHSNSIVNKINLFLSSEVDLYKRTNEIPETTFSLTGIYLLLRYRPSRFISFQTSYDSRKNVVYYETFQNYADSLYDNAMRQGYRFKVNLRPLNRLFITIGYGYRFKIGDLKTTQNYSGNISYSNLPFISGSLGISFSNLATSYLDGNIYGVRYSRDLFSSKLYSTLSVRRINYNFINGTPALEQTIAGADLSWRIIKELSLSLNYEGTFEADNNYSRFYFNITKRF